ncbi:hypothetical protein [Arthrobacter sp. Soil762]|uniref:hypothetical protein n=1 Tax=Arthrobacter sp. Soil762 TaxID=1736401 RepID=UPI0006F4F168|nr:hypothetical protein [Arthrobacter sp. Soil762]KRE74491.1 hypothetical protein ASG77_07250 [Arthrobacter sp. Soil762]
MFSAQGSTGQAATGLASITCSASGEAHESTASCLAVQGAVAILGMTVTTSTVAAIPAGTEMSLTVTDGGPGGANDAISVLVAGSNCVEDVPNQPVVSGDILVTEGPDVPPVVYPSSKKDCEKGGYLKYGFANHGDCISYVTAKRR